MAQPPWILRKIMGIQLQEIVMEHSYSGYRLYSKFQLGNKFIKRLKACEPSFENFVNVSQDVFHMVEVTDVSDNKDQKITVRATESRFSDNWMLEKEDLDIELTMYNDLAILMASNVKLKDVLIVWGGRLLFQDNKRCLEVNASCSLNAANVVLFHPKSEGEVLTNLDEKSDFLNVLYDYPIFQYEEIKYFSEIEVLKLYPRVKNASENEYEWREVRF